MTYVRRLKAVGAVLALAAIVTNAHVWGDSQKTSKDKARSSKDTPAADVVEDLTPSKFANGDAISYRTSGGETLFALQLKPRLDAIPAKPLDLLVMVDTSASQAQGPLASAIALTERFAALAGERDRISLWTANIPAATNDLTRGFKPAKSPGMTDGVEALKQEVPLGDTDLKDALTRAAASFDSTSDRRHAIVFLGDGMSIHNPLSALERAKLTLPLVAKEIEFVGVPLGPRVDGANLNGLASGTGGSVHSWISKEKMDDLVRDVYASLATPVLYPTSIDFGATVAEAFPTTLPPLRGDAPTLVIGKVKNGSSISYTIQGRLGEQPVKIEKTEQLPGAEMDNFFLVGAFEQWKNGKDQPALVRADRALAYAYQQSQVVRADLHSKAEWAMSRDNWEAAKNLLEQAKKLDANDAEAEGGLQIIEQLRSGALKKETLREDLKRQNHALSQVLAMRLREREPAAAQAPANQPPAQVPFADSLIQEQKNRIKVEEQRVGEIVAESEKQARQVLGSDPDAAKDILKRTYNAVRDNPDLGDSARQGLMLRLESSLRSVEMQGGRIKSEQDEHYSDWRLLRCIKTSIWAWRSSKNGRGAGCSSSRT